MGAEVRTQRVVVTDHHGVERIVGEVVGAVAELRLDLPREPHEGRTSVLVFANPGDDATYLGSGVGVQLWAEGTEVDEFSVWGT